MVTTRIKSPGGVCMKRWLRAGLVKESASGKKLGRLSSMFKIRWLLVFIALMLLVLLVPACGGGGKEETPITTATPTSTATPTATPNVTGTPTPTTSGSPVKIGAITSWSGAAAISGVALTDPIIKEVEWQVKQAGGILGGREVQIVRYDNRASVAEAAAGAQKLMYDDKVSALTLGGVGGAESDAISDFAEKNHILYVLYGILDIPNPKYTLSASFGYDGLLDPLCDYLIKKLHPKTAAYMSTDFSDGRDRVAYLKGKLEPAGIKTVSEQYISVTASDMSAYATQVKAKNPDFLWVDGTATEFFMNIMMAFQDLGGWGNIIVASPAGAEQAKTKAGAQGVYVTSLWAPSSTSPGSTKFVQDYAAVNNGSQPNATQVYYYNCFWTAIEAIKLAGTDTDLEKIANMARFSGKLEWDSPMGHMHYTADSNGYGGVRSTLTQIVNKQLVAVEIPQ